MRLLTCRSRTGYSLRAILFWGMVLAGLAGTASSQNIAFGKAQFSDVEILPDQTYDGLKGIAIRCKLQVSEVTATPSPVNYAIHCQVQDEDRQQLPATANAGRYADRDGMVRDSLAYSPTTQETGLDVHTMFLPYVAMGLGPGSQRISILVSLRNQSTGQVVAYSGPHELRFTKPAMQLYRMAVDRIESYTTDVDGETWDYKFLNARDIYPELIWSLRRGNQLVFESPKQKNDTIYIGTQGDRSPWLWLSEGDRIHFYVHDFDLLGFSDLVGSLSIDVWQTGFRSGRAAELNFERVRQATLSQDVLAPPKIAVTGYELLEQEQVDGVTGTVVKLDYTVQHALPNAKYFIGLSSEGVAPKSVKVIGPGAVPVGDGMVELLAQQSSLELFIPHYALRPISAHAESRRLQMTVKTLIDGQVFELSRQQRPLTKPPQPVTDIVYGQWSAGVHDIAGRGGLRITLAYEVPAAYFEATGDKAIFLVPQVSTAWGEIDPSQFEVLSPEGVAWQSGRLALSAANRKGALDLFLPFAKCPPGGGNVPVSAQYNCLLRYDYGETSLGTVVKGGPLDVPILRPLALGLREASVVRRQWILSNPDMYWELYCGNLMLLRSPVVPAERNARWEEDSVCQTIVAASDRIELRVYHKEMDGAPDRLLEIWSGQLSQLPDKEKGNFRLQTHNLKKMVIHLDYLDKGR